MSDSTTPCPPPSPEEIASYPDKIALAGEPMKDLVGNNTFALGVTRTLLEEAVQLLDHLRAANNPTDREFIDEQIGRFFTRIAKRDQPEAGR